MEYLKQLAAQGNKAAQRIIETRYFTNHPRKGVIRGTSGCEPGGVEADST